MNVDPTAIDGLGVLLRTNDFTDPRMSGPQEKALNAAVKADPHAKILGLDGNMRPVVAAKLGIPRELRVYAIMRNGDPTEPALKPNWATDGELGLSEVWTGRKAVR